MSTLRNKVEELGYTIRCTALDGWYALLPGETEFRHEDDGSHNYLGFFSTEEDLLEEIAELEGL